MWENLHQIITEFGFHWTLLEEWQSLSLLGCAHYKLVHSLAQYTSLSQSQEKAIPLSRWVWYNVPEKSSLGFIKPASPLNTTVPMLLKRDYACSYCKAAIAATIKQPWDGDTWRLCSGQLKHSTCWWKALWHSLCSLKAVRRSRMWRPGDICLLW